jgi:hypothetical protein
MITHFGLYDEALKHLYISLAFSCGEFKEDESKTRSTNNMMRIIRSNE